MSSQVDSLKAIRRAAALRDLGRGGAAVTLLESAIAENPDEPDLMNVLSLILLDLGESERALYAAEAAVSLAPSDRDYVVALAMAARATGDHDRALALTGQVLHHHPEHTEALVARYCTLREQFMAFTGRANSSERARLAAEAGQALAALQRLNPNDTGVHYLAADYDVILGNAADAEAAMKRGLALRPDDAGLLAHLAHLQARQGEGNESVSHARAALAIDPTEQTARHALTRAANEAMGNVAMWLGLVSLIAGPIALTGWPWVYKSVLVILGGAAWLGNRSPLSSDALDRAQRALYRTDHPAR